MASELLHRPQGDGRALVWQLYVIFDGSAPTGSGLRLGALGDANRASDVCHPSKRQEQWFAQHRAENGEVKRGVRGLLGLPVVRDLVAGEELGGRSVRLQGDLWKTLPD